MRTRFFFASLIFASLACALPAQPSTPDLPAAESLGTAIVQTAVAAQEQTATAQPTPSPTRFPTSTPIAAPPTNTPFSLFTATVPVETLAPEFEVTSGVPGLGGDVPYTGEPWTCAVRGVNPPRGWQVERDKEFSVTWTVLNTGTKHWTVNTIDFVFQSGFRHEGRSIQDLWKNVAPGNTVNLTVRYKSPKQLGEYRAIWNLRVGNRDFCGMVMSFEVIKR